MNFNPKGLDIEIEAAMWRNQVEEQTFKMTFIENINNELKARLTDKAFYEKQKEDFKMQSYKTSIVDFKK